MNSKVYVASLSPLKISAVSEVVADLLGAIEVKGVNTESGINEQPVGLEETLKGATNRVNDAKRQIKGPYQFIVGIENGIVEVGDNKWVDLALVVVQAAESGATYMSTSTGVVFASEYVDQARAKGFQTTTVGSVMAKHLGPKCSSTDPHSYLTGGKVSRHSTLVPAVRAAVAQLLFAQSKP